MQVTYCRHRDVSQLPSTRLRYQRGQESQLQGTQKLANMAAQPSTPSELQVGLQNINNTNKLSGVTSCFKIISLPLLAIFHGSTALTDLDLLIFDAS